ncbi:hypothetical protein BDY19DRAFT_547545 [Irpex rosettiformis]|uniref:Uncharacterized protein n=1 Tax=Irpex rosettiformis TaxID=378272 RepID=A0ACB8TQJ0_9APHY|nr:hypothetical protein BDY19DRAFT_547545 [Irpex rosettiformis]
MSVLCQRLLLDRVQVASWLVYKKGADPLIEAPSCQPASSEYSPSPSTTVTIPLTHPCQSRPRNEDGLLRHTSKRLCPDASLTHPCPTHFSLGDPSSSIPSDLGARYPRCTPMATSLTLFTWLSQSMPASRSSGLPRAAATTCVLSFCSVFRQPS